MEKIKEDREGTEFRKGDRVVSLSDLTTDDDRNIPEGSEGVIEQASTKENNVCIAKFDKFGTATFTHYREYDYLNTI